MTVTRVARARTRSQVTPSVEFKVNEAMELQFDWAFALKISHMKTNPVVIGFFGGHKLNISKETIFRAGHNHRSFVTMSLPNSLKSAKIHEPG